MLKLFLEVYFKGALEKILYCTSIKSGDSQDMDLKKNSQKWLLILSQDPKRLNFAIMQLSSIFH